MEKIPKYPSPSSSHTGYRSTLRTRMKMLLKTFVFSPFQAPDTAYRPRKIHYDFLNSYTDCTISHKITTLDYQYKYKGVPESKTAVFYKFLLSLFFILCVTISEIFCKCCNIKISINIIVLRDTLGKSCISMSEE